LRNILNSPHKDTLIIYHTTDMNAIAVMEGFKKISLTCFLQGEKSSVYIVVI